MDQAVFYLRIFPGTEAEYDRRHAEIWPELVDEIRESGLRNFSGFRRGTDVWYYTEAEPGVSVEDAFAIHGPKPANQRWNRYFRDVIAQITDDSGSLSVYDKVFESDGPAAGRPVRARPVRPGHRSRAGRRLRGPPRRTRGRT